MDTIMMKMTTKFLYIINIRLNNFLIINVSMTFGILFNIFIIYDIISFLSINGIMACAANFLTVIYRFLKQPFIN